MSEAARADSQTKRPEESRDRFLIVRLGSLGDLVHTLPAVAALRSSFPDAGIDWIVERKWSSLIELVAGLDAVIPMERSITGHFACVRRLRQAHYSCAVDFQGLYKSALLAWRSGAKRRIGFDRAAAREPGAAFFYTERVAPTGRHVAEMNLSLAVHAGARPSREMRFPLRLPEEETRKLQAKLWHEGIRGDYVVVSPGGGWKSKCWPAERYGAVCDALWRQRGIPAVVNAGPGEDELAATTVGACTEARPLVLHPSLVELCVLLANARVVAAADTGPLHLAAALGTRVVALFGPTDPERNGPISQGAPVPEVVCRSAVLRNVSHDATTYARGGVYSPSMLSLTVEQVMASVTQEIGRRPLGEQGTGAG